MSSQTRVCTPVAPVLQAALLTVGSVAQDYQGEAYISEPELLTLEEWIKKAGFNEEKSSVFPQRLLGDGGFIDRSIC